MSKTNTRHTKFSIVPCNMQPNTALQIPCTKVPIIARSLDHTVPEQSAAPRHTQHAEYRPEPPSLYDGTSPLHSTQQHTQSFQLVFQFHVHSHSSRRCVNSKCKIALIRLNRNVQSVQHRLLTHTNWSIIPLTMFYTMRPFTGQVPRLPHVKRVALPARFSPTTQSHSFAADNLASKPVDVCVPSDLRTHVFLSCRRVR